MTKSNFNIGDRVRTLQRLMYLPANITGVIVEIESDGIIKRNGPYGVKIDEEEDLIAFYPPEHLELIGSSNRRTAFLTELQLLLKSHDATIQSYMSGVDTVGLCIYFGDENTEEVDYQHNDTICEINADNIMNFYKE